VSVENISEIRFWRCYIIASFIYW